MIEPIRKPTPRVRERKPLRSKPNPIPTSVRDEVLDRCGRVCTWCEVPGGALDLHHRLPRSRGGKNNARTLTPVHRTCHRFIHDHPLEARSRGFLVRSESDL